MHSNKTTIVTAALLILTILAAGCISTDPVQTKTAAQGNQIDAKETPPKVDAPVEEAEPAPVETHWWDSKPTFNLGIIEANDNLFNQDVEGIINEGQRSKGGSFDVFDENRNMIFQHSERTASTLNLERELQPAQYRQLVEEYGRPSLIIMETIDTDGGGMDKVAMRYVGSKGEFTVAVFSCSVDTSNDNSKEGGLFDMSFKVLPTRVSCDNDVESTGHSSLIYIYLEPNDGWVLSNLERLY